MWSITTQVDIPWHLICSGIKVWCDTDHAGRGLVEAWNSLSNTFVPFRSKMPDVGKITGNKSILAWIMWDLLAYLMHIVLNATESDKRHFSFSSRPLCHIHHVISDGSIHRKCRCINRIQQKSYYSFESQCEMHKLQMGTVHGTCDRAVNEGLWLAFVKTQWSSYMLKVRLLFWHEEMKTFYFLGNVMIWIKIVRLAVSSYHSAGVSYMTFSRNCHFPPLWCHHSSAGERPLFSRHVICPGCYHPHCATPSQSPKCLCMYRPAGCDCRITRM